VSTSSEHVRDLEDMKHVVHLLHTALHLPEHHLLKERQLLEKGRGGNIIQIELSPTDVQLHPNSKNQDLSISAV